MLADQTGPVFAWGLGNDEQLGNGASMSKATPVQVAGVGGSGSLGGQTLIAAGGYHTLALATTRTITTNYGYDRLYRLTSGGTPGTPNAYTYDPNGNRLSLTQGFGGPTSYVYDQADRIQSVGGQTYSVDANGNLTAYPGATLAYDQANRLTTATISGTTTTYVYDGDGKRASKTVGSTPTNYAYDANHSLPVVLTDGTLKYVWDVGLAYATDDSGNVQGVYHSDGLGSVRSITNAAGAITQTYETDEFGVAALVQGTSSQPFGFAGEQRDAETSFVDLRARYYDPSLGRFLSQDPLTGCAGNPPSLNRYSYAMNNPIDRFDPSGLSTTGGDTPGPSTGTVSITLQDSYDSVGNQSRNDSGQSCSSGPLTFCGLWAQGPNGALIAGILWDPCWRHPWTCDKGEGGGGGSRERIAGTFDSFEQARNAASEQLGGVDETTGTEFRSSFGVGQGEVTGFETRVDGQWKRFRIDFDNSKGLHIHVETKGQNLVYEVRNSTYSDFLSQLEVLNR